MSWSASSPLPTAMQCRTPQTLASDAVVQDELETALDAEQHLLEVPVGVTGTCSTRRHRGDVVHPLDTERNVLLRLDEGEVSPRLRDRGKLEEAPPADLQVG